MAKTMSDKHFNELMSTVSVDEKGEANYFGKQTLHQIFKRHTEENFSHQQLDKICNTLLGFRLELGGTRKIKYFYIRESISSTLRVYKLADRM